jgi:hypothetical protein
MLELPESNDSWLTLDSATSLAMAVPPRQISLYQDVKAGISLRRVRGSRPHVK